MKLILDLGIKLRANTSWEKFHFKHSKNRSKMVFKMKRKYKPRLHNNDDDTLHLFASLLLQSIFQTATKRSNLLFVSL